MRDALDRGGMLQEAFALDTSPHGENYAFFCQIFEHICHTWPEAGRIRESFGLERIYMELEKHPFAAVLEAHIRRTVKDHRGRTIRMTWELCTLLMVERKITCVDVAMELLHTIIYMWLLCGVPVELDSSVETVRRGAT